MKAAFLLHGFATDINDYSSIIPFLKKRYDAIFLESLPGHGLNADLSDFTATNVFEYINKKMDEIKLEYDCIDLYGYSMGGALATYLASKYKVNKVVLLAPANKYINAGIVTSRLKKELDLLSSGEKERHDDISENDRRSLQVMFQDLIPRYNINTITTFMSIVRMCNDELKENDTKTLLIRGDLDELVPSSSSEFLKTYFKNLTEVIIPDLGHLMLRSSHYRLIINEIKKFIDE